MTTLVVLQPGYLPWLGFFDQMRRADVFVYYDDVQFDKHGWRNRNRIKSSNGPVWLTVPILATGRQGQAIQDVEIDNRGPWAKKHLTTIKQSYAKAPHLVRYFPSLEDVLGRPWTKLVDLDIAVASLMCEWFGLKREVVRSSGLSIGGGQSERLLNFCQHFGADRYLSGDSAKSYLDLGSFERAGVQVEWQSYQHPTYSQLHGEFIPFLSALDLALNEGPKSSSILEGTT